MEEVLAGAIACKGGPRSGHPRRCEPLLGLLLSRAMGGAEGSGPGAQASGANAGLVQADEGQLEHTCDEWLSHWVDAVIHCRLHAVTQRPCPVSLWHEVPHGTQLAPTRPPTVLTAGPGGLPANAWLPAPPKIFGLHPSLVWAGPRLQRLAKRAFAVKSEGRSRASVCSRRSTLTPCKNQIPSKDSFFADPQFGSVHPARPHEKKTAKNPKQVRGTMGECAKKESSVMPGGDFFCQGWE